MSCLLLPTLLWLLFYWLFPRPLERPWQPFRLFLPIVSDLLPDAVQFDIIHDHWALHNVLEDGQTHSAVCDLVWDRRQSRHFLWLVACSPCGAIFLFWNGMCSRSILLFSVFTRRSSAWRTAWRGWCISPDCDLSNYVSVTRQLLQRFWWVSTPMQTDIVAYWLPKVFDEYKLILFLLVQDTTV